MPQSTATTAADPNIRGEVNAMFDNLWTPDLERRLRLKDNRDWLQHMIEAACKRIINEGYKT